MDRNLLLAMALSFLVITLWGIYSGGNKTHPEVVGAKPPAAATAPGAEAPSPEVPPQETASAPPQPAAAPAPALPTAPEDRVTVRSDLYEAEFTNHGGALVRWSLLKYDDPSQVGRPHVNMAVAGSDGSHALTTPFRELGLGDLSRLPYTLERPDPNTLVYSAQIRGVTIRKTYLLDPERYLMRLRVEVRNGTDRQLRPQFEVAWPAHALKSADYTDFDLAAWAGGSREVFPITSSRSFLGLGGGSPTEPKEHTGAVDWAGVEMRYFLAAVLPDDGSRANVRFVPVAPKSEALLQVNFAATDLPAGERLDREYRVYLGPKEPDRLDAVGDHLDEAILKGWFPPLTRFFTGLLTAAHGFIPNYGVAILLITIVVRLLMAPLMTRQMKSMKKMSALQPRMKEVQEKYKDDRQKQSEAMMALYKEAGMSPFSMFGGCLPMFLQLPVFIGFYYALQGSIQLRQQPFFGWIDDLSQPESLFTLPGLHIPVRVLPLLMGGSMILQQRLSPTTMDPAQARMMMTVMPILFTVMFYQFASGLVLYWLTSTLLGIGQQILTNRRTD